MFSFFVSPPENQFLEDAFELGPVYKEWILLFFFLSWVEDFLMLEIVQLNPSLTD